jgi:protoporphyrinogen oxidase
MTKNIFIIGAGPAGITAAYELQKAGEKNITVLEADYQVGGISRTIQYKGNRIDLGGHRFFSKSDWVLAWWTTILPVAPASWEAPINLRYRGQKRTDLPLTESKTGDPNAVMLVRDRVSRIYYNNHFFSYPLKLNLVTLRKLGLHKTITFGIGYLLASLKPIVPEKSLEDFFINRFGRPLYLQFFKEYTEKVWGVPCAQISAQWGAQRIKSLSIGKALWHSMKAVIGLGSKQVQQTSLTEHFLYPKLGPGQMWEVAAKQFVEQGGKIIFGAKVSQISILNNEVSSIAYQDHSGILKTLQCDQLISTMPIKDLVIASKEHWPNSLVQIASNLAYRDFITVGLLYHTQDLPRPLIDNWIYIQAPGVQVGRVQVFNNWSPSLVADPNTIWLGLEYFCKEKDALWQMSDMQLQELAQKEMLQIGLVSSMHAQDAVVIRVPKAYPGYFGTAYQQFDVIRSYLDRINNLFVVGRNGMHRYNNQDHSMLTAKEAANQIITGVVDKNKIWAINIDDEYHEK